MERRQFLLGIFASACAASTILVNAEPAAALPVAPPDLVPKAAREPAVAQDDQLPEAEQAQYYYRRRRVYRRRFYRRRFYRRRFYRRPVYYRRRYYRPVYRRRIYYVY
jgi:hypothetical protein